MERVRNISWKHSRNRLKYIRYLWICLYHHECSNLCILYCFTVELLSSLMCVFYCRFVCASELIDGTMQSLMCCSKRLWKVDNKATFHMNLDLIFKLQWWKCYQLMDTSLFDHFKTHYSAHRWDFVLNGFNECCQAAAAVDIHSFGCQPFFFPVLSFFLIMFFLSVLQNWIPMRHCCILLHGEGSVRLQTSCCSSLEPEKHCDWPTEKATPLLPSQLCEDMNTSTSSSKSQ